MARLCKWNIPSQMDSSVSPVSPVSDVSLDSVVSFDLIDIKTLQFKLLGTESHMHHSLEAQAPPAPHAKDDKVKLISGKFPLNDYNDLNIHTYVFEKEDGTQFSGVLCGFTYDCTFDGQGKSLGTPKISVRLSAPTTASTNQ